MLNLHFGGSGVVVLGCFSSDGQLGSENLLMMESLFVGYPMKNLIANSYNKLSLVRSKRYIQGGFTSSLIHYYEVLKGNDDVCMVHNGTASGFNSMVWISSLIFLPFQHYFVVLHCLPGW